MTVLPLELGCLAGVAYVPGGRSPKEGLDCWGFFREARRLLGLSVPPLNLITEKSLQDAAFRAGMASPEWIIKKEPQRGLLALFRTPRGHHCGVMLDGVAFAHITRAGLGVARLDDRRWRAACIGVYDYEPTRQEN